MGCHNSMVIPAPIGKVWDALSDFTNLDCCKGVIETLERKNDIAGDQIGCQRLLNGAFLETLRGIDTVNHQITYSIDQGPPPMGNPQNYIGTINLHEVTADNTTLVVWNSCWDSSDGGTAEFCNPVYQALLGALKENINA